MHRQTCGRKVNCDCRVRLFKESNWDTMTIFMCAKSMQRHDKVVLMGVQRNVREGDARERGCLPCYSVVAFELATITCQKSV